MCPTCNSSEKTLRKLVHIPGSGESDLAPVALWDPCWDAWHIAKYESRYSGPGKSGVCVCGCSWEDHHLGMVMNPDYAEQTGEAYVPDECTAFGFNEVGGMKYNKETKEWEDHCHGYVDAGDKQGSTVHEPGCSCGFCKMGGTKA